MKKMNTQFLLMIITLPILLMAAMGIYLFNMTQSFETEIMNRLAEVSQQGVNSVQTEINNKMALIQDLALAIDLDAIEEDEELSDRIGRQLASVVKNHDLYSMGILLDDDRIVLADGEITTKKSIPYLNSLTLDYTNVSGRIAVDDEEDMYINVYSTPIVDPQTYEQRATLFAAFETNTFRDITEIKSYNGEGYTYLVESSGDVVFDSSNVNSFDDMTNVYLSLQRADERNAEAMEDVARLIERKSAGYTIFINRGVRKYLYCQPVGMNDWYLLTVVPVNVANIRAKTIVYSTVIFAVIIILIYTAVMIFVVGQHRRKEEELAMLAYVDSLTGGHTYAKFREEFKRITQKHPDYNYAVVNLDLNKFKMINDLYGYEEGDKIIKLIDSLWKDELGEYESSGHRAADQFVLLLNYEDRQELIDRIEAYYTRLQQAVEGKHKLNLIVGIYEVKDLSDPFDVIVDRSMMAFSTAKSSNSGYIAFYNDAMEEGLIWERYVEDHFQLAIDKKEFKVFYQAKVDAVTGKISGAEALVRWVRPDGSIVSPGRFIPVLENNGSIAKLDRYMFRQVLEDQKRWMDQGIPIVPVSVNLSRAQMVENGFVEHYRNMLLDSKLPAEYISLEFTESAMFDNEEILKDTVEQLHEMGIKVLVDDFGVGFSSMSTLKALPVDILKMDKSFVDSIGDERGDKIVVGIIEFAVSLGMSVTAEGVEEEHQYLFLKAHKCNDIQGYYFARPLPSEDYCRKFLVQEA